MPPRLQPQTCQCLRTTRSQIISDAQSFRSFHASPRAQDGEADQSKRRSRRSMTKLRREMGEWLSGPGAKFRRPAFGSTNYLSAYDSFGNLKRQRFQQAKVSEELSPEAQAAEEEEMVRKEIEEGISDAERYDRAEARASERKQRMIDAKRPPPERPGDLHPYPLNTKFRSQPVLSEELREQLYRAVVVRGEDLQGVSAIYAVDARRVAAVVRLKTIEKQWMEEGKKLARPYSEAVLAMLPTTPYNPNNPVSAAHEGINDLPVHPATRLQLFQPTSESRHFTREDAAKAFSPNLLPADDRIAHPQLVHIERWNLEDLPRAERQQRLDDMDSEERAALEKKARKQKEWQERTQRTVQGRRWDFKFQDISAENVGKDGRSSKGIGARYGMPHTDRKSGEVKIPTSVE